MRIVILVFTLFFGMQTFAQKDCEFTINIKDSIGTYKETKDYLMSEKIFAGKATYLFFSLGNNDGTPLLKVQKIVKSSDFIEASCFDASSKVYLQLQNGKIVTLIYGDEDTCGSLIHLNDQKMSTRVTTGNFLFVKGNMQDLKKSPVSLIRILYATETSDLVVQKELVSELTKETYTPENYFIENLDCVLD